MEPFEIHILGCGSALPTTRHNATAQIVKIGNKQFMIDCGEGTQVELRRNHIHFSFINHIFISHLHGDHCFGLIGLISTFSLLGRTAPLHIYADPHLEEVMKPQIEFFCKGMNYPLFFHGIDATKHQVIFEDNTITVETLPLKHRMPCCGFLFREKPKKRHLIGEMVNFYDIPAYMRQSIKDGADYTTPDGEIIPNSRLTKDADRSRSYAYCSDTAPCTHNNDALEGADLLYHEATFAESEKERATQTLHSTARQAAQVASRASVKRLLIGHYSSRYETPDTLLNEARELFPDTIAAKEGMVINID
ncbi:MAG: ribonuclease Z [Bacteroidaceae bacterium]|nr:ribonuclease Z [Bacteroidaceae bacterium]